MYYGTIKNCDIANGLGVRISLFVSGCRNHCPGCFQPETWAFDYGQPFTEETEKHLLELLKPDYINGLTVLGGDPFEPENQRVLLPFLRRVKKEYPDKDIWAYTGYTWEQLTSGTHRVSLPETKEMLLQIDTLVDGPFTLIRKISGCAFVALENQRIIDVKQSFEASQIVLWRESSSS